MNTIRHRSIVAAFTGISLVASSIALAQQTPAAPASKQATPAAPPATTPAAPAKPAAPATPALPPPPPPPAAPAVPPQPAAPTFKELTFEGAKPTAQSIFQKHLDAVGGAAAWESKTSMHATGTIEIPAVGLKGPMEIWLRAPMQLLMSMDLPGVGVTRSGFDGTVGWTIDPMRGPNVMGAQEVADLKREANFKRDLEYAQKPGASEVLGLFEFNGRPAWQVKVANPGGNATQNFYDKESGLFIGMTMKASTPMGELPVVVTAEDYKDFGGVKMPAKSTTAVMMQTQVMTTDTIEWDTVPPTIFELPPEIKTLAAQPKPAAPASPAAPGQPATPPAAKPAGTAAPAAPAGNGKAK